MPLTTLGLMSRMTSRRKRYAKLAVQSRRSNTRAREDFSMPTGSITALLKRGFRFKESRRGAVINWTRSRDISSRYVDPPGEFIVARGTDLSGRIRFISVSQARAATRREIDARFRSRLANFARATFRKNRVLRTRRCVLFALHDRFVDSRSACTLHRTAFRPAVRLLQRPRRARDRGLSIYAGGVARPGKLFKMSRCRAL